MKLSIKTELIYCYSDETQVIANLGASHTRDQKIFSESLDIQPSARVLADKTPYGDRRLRASLSGEVAIRYWSDIGAAMAADPTCELRLQVGEADVIMPGFGADDDRLRAL